MIAIRNLTKIYESRAGKAVALDHVSFTLPETGLVFLLGRSGSGKTTLLNLLGGLDAATEGELLIDGTSSQKFQETDYDAYRNHYVGFIFQEYNLLDDLTIAGNIALALNLQGQVSKAEAAEKINAALEQVDLAGYGGRQPSELSGGQKQRIAIARALVKDPRMILADEPTGALDSENSTQIFDLLKQLSREKLIVVVSHDRDFAHRYGDRIIELQDGRVYRDSRYGQQALTKQVCYHEDRVFIPAGYQFSDAEWQQVQAYLQGLISGSAPEAPLQADVQETAVCLVEQEIQEEEARCQPLKTSRSRLPLGAAVQMGLQSMKRKKLRLTFVTLLCVVAFLLVGVADVFACYNWHGAMADSLVAEAPRYLAVSKEYYNDYDYTKISPMLPTKEAVETFAAGTIRVEGGKPGWYDGYMMEDEDLEELSRRTGLTFKGVYVPRLSNCNMDISGNYINQPTADLIAPQEYVSKLGGFMELTQEDLEAFHYTLLAGKLPDGDKNEIAVSKYVYDSFAKLGFWYQTKDSVEICFTKEVGRGVDDNGYNVIYKETVYVLELTWEEFKAEGYERAEEVLRQLPPGTEQEIGVWSQRGSSRQQSATIVNKPEDLVGSVLFIEDRHYTITGIVDTGFDVWAEEDTDRIDRVLAQEQARGMATLAFVGQGKVQEIAARYPVTVTSEDATFKISDDELYFIGNTFSCVSDFDPALLQLDQATSNKSVYVTPNCGYDFVRPEKPDVSYSLYSGGHHILDMNFQWKDSGVLYTDTDWSSKGLKTTDKGDLYAYEFGWRGGIGDDNWFDTLALTDYTFHLLTEGRAGTYTYAVAAMPDTQMNVAEFLDGCYAEEDHVRYKLESLTAYELDYLHSTLLSLSRIFRYVALAMAVFASLMFWNFISTSIHQKKRAMGIMRALGAGGRDVFTVFFTEGFMVAGISAVIASVLTAVAAIGGNLFLRNTMGLRLQLLSFSPRQVVLIFALGFAVAFVSSVLPIRRTARQKPVEAIRT